MEISQSQLSSIHPPPDNLTSSSSKPPHSDHRHSLIAGRFRDALFSAVAAKYSINNGTAHSLPFRSDQFKSVIDCRIHENFPSFRTPTHLPYASMILRAIAEVGEEDGLSEESISGFIMNEYKDLPWAHSAYLRRHLGKLCENGEIVKLKCGRYNFKVEDKGVKRKKGRRKSGGRSRYREVKSADEIEEDFDRKKRSKKLIIIGPRVEEVVTSNGTEEQSDLCREVTVGVEKVDHVGEGQIVVHEQKEVEVDEMVDKQHGEKSKHKHGAKVFNWKKQSQNLVILGLRAPLANKEIEKQSGSLGEEVREVEGDHTKGGQIQVRGEVDEVQPDVLIHQTCEKEVKSRDGFQDFDEKKQSQNVVAGNIGAQEAPTMAWNEEKRGSPREEICGAKESGYDHDRQVIMIYELKEVNGRDGVEDFGGRKQSQDLVIVGLHSKEALMTKGTEDQCSSFRKNVDDGVEGKHAQAGQTEVLDKFKEVQVEIIDEHPEEEKQGERMEEPKERASVGSIRDPVEEATLEFFDAMSYHSNAEENRVIDDAEGCKKLLEENENLEFFDAKSDHGYDGVNETIGAQSSKEMILGEVSNKQNRLEERPSKFSDDQTKTRKGCEAEDLQLTKEHSQVRWPSKITETLAKHSKQVTPRAAEADKNEKSEALSPEDIICSPSQPWGHRGRGRPRKLKVQETLATSLSSLAHDGDQRYLASNVVDREASGPNTGDGTRHIDQQGLNLPRGRGRGWGRPRVVRQDQNSGSRTFSPSKHLNHRQSPGKRRGRPSRQKFDEDTVSQLL